MMAESGASAKSSTVGCHASRRAVSSGVTATTASGESGARETTHRWPASTRATSAASRSPGCVGFGVRTPAQAAGAVKHADGAVVASALIDIVKADLDANGGKPKPDTVARVLAQVKALADGVRGARIPA